MTPEQALQNVTNVCIQVKMTIPDCDIVKESLMVLRQAIAPKVPVQTEKPEHPGPGEPS